MKLLELMGEKLQHDPEKTIYNFSSDALSDADKSIPTKGLNFALPPKRMQFHDYLLPFELLFRDVMNEKVSNEKLLNLKSRIKDIGLSSFRTYNKKDRQFANISKDEYEAFIKLSGNKDIIIQKADKGNTVVIVDKQVYIEKIETLLGDTSKFVKVEFSKSYKCNDELRHVLDMETVVTKCLERLLSNNSITEEEFKFLKPVGSKPGVLYGLCKVHKETSGRSPPFRPILSAIGTSTFNIAKFFVPILKDYTMNSYSLKDSFAFAEEIVQQDTSLFIVQAQYESTRTL